MWPTLVSFWLNQLSAVTLTYARGLNSKQRKTLRLVSSSQLYDAFNLRQLDPVVVHDTLLPWFGRNGSLDHRVVHAETVRHPAPFKTSCAATQLKPHEPYSLIDAFPFTSRVVTRATFETIDREAVTPWNSPWTTFIITTAYSKRRERDCEKTANISNSKTTTLGSATTTTVETRTTSESPA